MVIQDDFFQELMGLAGILNTMHTALYDDLSPDSLVAIDKAAAIVSARALEIMHGFLEEAAIARQNTAPQVCSQCDNLTKPTDYAASTTVPANTSSQPSSADLGPTQATVSKHGDESPKP